MVAENKTIDDVLTLDELRLKFGNHPAARSLPGSTGRVNPVTKAVVRGAMIFLVYDALNPYISRSERRSYVYSEGNGNDATFFDPLTSEYRRREYPNECFDPEIEIDDRISFLKRPYLVGVDGEGVFGGARQHYLSPQELKKGRRVMVSHIKIFDGLTGKGYGGALLEEFISQIVKPRFDGVRFDWSYAEIHEGCVEFFAKRGFDVVNSPRARSYTAKLLFEDVAPYYATPRVV